MARSKRRESPEKRAVRRLGLVLFLIYLVCLIYFLFFADWYNHTPGSHIAPQYNLVPFREIRRFLVYRKHFSGMSLFLNLGGNIIGFLPFGFFLPVISRMFRKGWLVTLLGSLFITVLAFIMILTVYGRFFKIYMYAAIAPVPLSTFAGEPTQNVGKTFLKSFCAVLLEGAIIVLACIIFSVFASSPPVVDSSAAAVTQVWAYVVELIFNMLVLVGSVKMADKIVREMMGL